MIPLRGRDAVAATAIGGLCLLGAALIGGCAGTPRQIHYEALNAVLWQRSAEYEAIALQTFLAASAALDAALQDRTWTALPSQQGADIAALPPAVILDIDETVLDNSPHNAQRTASGEPHTSASFGAWVARSNAAAIPGALEFCRTAADRGVAIFYVTNRDAEQADATFRNLAALGFPVQAERLLPRIDTSDKERRRRAVAADHRVVLLIGDNLGDFDSGSRATPAERSQLVARYRHHWGRRWFVLPNPVYGDWDSALYDFEYSAAEPTKLQRKLDALSIDSTRRE